MPIRQRFFLGFALVFIGLVLANEYRNYQTYQSKLTASKEQDRRIVSALLGALAFSYDRPDPLRQAEADFHGVQKIATDFERMGNKVAFRRVSPAEATGVDQDALLFFVEQPKEQLFSRLLSSPETEKHYLATPIRMESSCLDCHGELPQTSVPFYSKLKEMQGHKLGQVVGLLTVRLEALESTEQMQQEHLQHIFIHGMTLVLLFAGLYFFLDATFFRKLALLEVAAHRIGGGDLHNPIEVTGEDELARVGIAFNQMQEALLHREDKVRQERTRNLAMIQAIPDSLLILDDQARVRSFFPSSHFPASLSNQIKKGQSLLGILDPEAERELMSALGRIWNGLRLEAYPLDLVDQDRVLHFEVRFSRIPEQPEVLLIFRDQTEGKEAQARAKLLNQAVDQSPAGVLITDHRARILYANPKFCLTSGYSQEELVGQNPSVLKSGQTQEGFYRMLWETITQGEQWSGIFENKRKNGEIYHASALIVPMQDEKGKISHFLAVTEDITQQIKQQNQLRQALQQAEAASQAKSNFLATMSHELRTPMNGIMGMVQLLLQEKLAASYHNQLEIIYNSSKVLLKILNDILEVSRLEAGQVEVEHGAFSLREELASIYRLFKVTADVKHLTLQYRIPPEIPDHLKGDVRRFGQIISNLVGNALKFTTQGEVNLQVSLQQDNPKSCLLRFEVRDTGIGIEKVLMEHIFNAFTQADESSTRYFGGVGLGLSIVKNYVDLLGGQVGAQSTVGQGSLFWVELPFEKKSPDEPQPAELLFHPLEVNPLPELTQAKILVVEDEKANQEVITGMLEVLGYDFVVAENGKQALELLLSQPVQLVFMDCLMPVLNGFDTTRRIREWEASGKLDHHVPIVALTAKVMAGDREKCLESGMDDFLPKPVFLNHLQEMLIKHLD